MIAVTTGVVLVLGAFAGTAVAFVLADGARAAEARRFEDVRALAHYLLFDLNEQLRSVPGNTTARADLAQAIALLVERLGLSGVITGEDFTFGKGRGGNIDVLRDLGAAHGLRATAMGPVKDEGGVISSSRIRDALKAGDCATATRLLTRPFTVEGVVQHGDKNGRLLGFPTANIDMGHYLRPRYGIYAVKGRLPDGRVLIVHGANRSRAAWLSIPRLLLSDDPLPKREWTRNPS